MDANANGVEGNAGNAMGKLAFSHGHTTYAVTYEFTTSDGFGSGKNTLYIASDNCSDAIMYVEQSINGEYEILSVEAIHVSVIEHYANDDEINKALKGKN